MWDCVTGATKGKREEDLLSLISSPFFPLSPLPCFDACHADYTMFTTSAICSRRHRLEVDLHPRRKKSVIIIYTQSQTSRSRQPNEPALWGSCLDIRWRLWFLRWSFLIWTFLYGSLSSRSLYTSGYSHVNKTHFHKKGLTLFNSLEIFWNSKRSYSLLEKWHLICSAERGWLRSLQGPTSI